MGRVWKRLRAFLPPRRRPAGELTIAERFRHFRTIGAANDAFLSSLASLRESLDRRPVVGMGAVSAACQALSEPVGIMTRSLIAMAGGRYQSLVQRYETIERELSLEVLKERPIEFGPLVVWPGDADATRAPVVGPKAARLAEAVSGALAAIPPFFAVTVYGYRLFMEATGIQDRVDAVSLSTDPRQAASLRALSDMVTAAIAEAPVPEPLAEALRSAFARLRHEAGGEWGVAVRSSAVVEDAESSFAGQFESVLNVREDGLPAAYKRVVASKYRLEAMRYALARGFVDQDVAMPVLVMAMVQPRAAGVAYSRSPGKPDVCMVSAVPGLAQPVVDGRVIPDILLVGAGEPPRVLEATPGMRAFSLHCDPGGGLIEERDAVRGDRELAIDEATALRVARTAWALERHFGTPQDIEWALDTCGELRLVQTRPLHLATHTEASGEDSPNVDGYRVLLRAGVGASGGVASGPVHRITDPALVDSVPEGVVLVTPTTSPRLAGVIPLVRAIVAAAGSPTGHMATVAREFGVPCIVGAGTATAVLTEGAVVTVDGWAGVVYEGEVRELVAGGPREADDAGRRDPVRAALGKLLEKVEPLTLTEPESPQFRPLSCTTLHDIARFVHQRSMAEMFAIERLAPAERRRCRRLAWAMPMEVMILDLGGGLAPFAGRNLPADYVNSRPLQALMEGMTDPRLRWSGPVGFDLKGFMSVVVRSAADDQRYGEPSYALCSLDYAHFASRLAYHFATVDAICGSSVNENYARFLFFGGAAVAERRALRGHFLATVLRYNGFAVKHVGDRVDAILAKRGAEQIEESLVMLGRLMVASRHLDMVMESRSTAEILAQAFLSGDFGFERVRRAGT